MSRVTDAVPEDLKGWEPRLLNDHYSVVFLDAPVLKTRDVGSVQCRVCNSL